MKLPKMPHLTSDYSRHQRLVSILLGLAVGVAACGLFSFLQERTWIRFMENLIQRTWMDRNFETYGTSGSYVHTGAATLSRFSEQVVLVETEE